MPEIIKQKDRVLLKFLNVLEHENIGHRVITQLLSVLCEYYVSDYAYAFEFDESGLVINNAYEFCKVDLPSKKDKLKNLEKKIVNRWLNEFIVKDEVVISKLSSMNKNTEEYFFLNELGIKTLAAVPMKFDNKIIGFIAVVNPVKNLSSLLILKLIACTVCSKLAEQSLILKKTIFAVAKTYTAMYSINLEKDTFQIFNSNASVDNFLDEEKGHAAEQMIAVTKGTTSSEFVEEMLKFTDLTTVAARLSGKNFICQDFIGNFKGWCHAIFIPVDYDSDGKIIKLLYIIQVFDNVKRKEIETQKKLKEALENQNEIYAEILHIQSTGVVVSAVDDNSVLMMNDAAKNMFGVKLSNRKKIDILALVNKVEFYDKETVIERLREVRVDGGKFIFEFFYKKSSDDYLYAMATIKNVTLGNGSKILITEFTDITENKKLEKELIMLSETDSLTHIFNRRSGERCVEKSLSSGQKGMFCLFDVDKFKSINDTYGHNIGDEVLITIAKCLKKTFRANDIIMRLGGDEFAVYATGITDRCIGEVCLKRFFNAINQIDIASLMGRKISVSLGAVICDKTEEMSFDELYQMADSVMYVCKNNSGNQYSFF